jgi:C4-dicarboxylate-specific signal transduction histidine kinase
MAQLACLISIAGAALTGVLAYKDVSSVRSSEDNASWLAFELGYEFQRLLLAAEKGESVDDIRFRGDIYLSRVKLLRDAPVMMEVRNRVPEQDLTDLFRSTQQISDLLAALETVERRDALLWQLRADTRMIRELMHSLAKVYLRIGAERRANDNRNMLRYLVVLELLMIALLVLSAIVFRATRKLRATGRELARQLATQDAILKSVDTAIIGLGPRDSVLYSNPNALALLGPSAGRGFSLAGRGPERDCLLGEVTALLRDLPGADAGQVSRKIRLNSPSGVRHYVIHASSAGSLPAAEGELLEEQSRIVAVTDVTVEEEAALRREEYDVKLGEASRLLAFATMSGGIVHEISQPLAAIRNYAYALKVSLGLREGNQEHRAIVERLSEEAERAIEVVRNIRRMGPQEADGESVCDINEAIAHSVRLVSLGNEPPPPVVVTVREGRVLVAGALPMIGQVVVNLLKNALSASTASGRVGAEISVKVGEDMAEVTVADFGDGVSEDASKTMFSPFAKSARGMGLGLAICQRIAESLGGSLSWENGKAGGAVFTFAVPLAKEGIPA